MESVGAAAPPAQPVATVPTADDSASETSSNASDKRAAARPPVSAEAEALKMLRQEMVQMRKDMANMSSPVRPPAAVPAPSTVKNAD